MKHFITLAALLSWVYIPSFAQTSSICNYVVFIDIYSVYKNINSINKTITEDIDESRSVQYTLKDCMGAMEIKGYKNKVMELEGNYVNSIDTLKGCFNVMDPFSLKQKIIVEKYFQPLKNGKWKYYDSKGNIIKEEEWENGILLNTKKRN